MTIQTYCTRDELEDIAGELGVLAAIDDADDGVESVQETSYITSAIERAANKINGYVRQQYVLADVAANDWLKEANATVAVFMLRTRRGNPAESSVEEAYQDVLATLEEIRWGRQRLPNQVPSFNHLPTVSSMQVQLNNTTSPVTVNVAQSTGPNPVGDRRRVTTNNYPSYWT